MILLDTNVLIELRQLRLPPGEYALSALVYAELRSGVERMTDPGLRRARLADIGLAETVFASHWLPFDRAAADGFAYLSAIVARSRPAHARSTDVMLAGQAYALGAGLLTSNAKDFELVADHVDIIAPDRIR
ncbi:MAG: hypothetical protein JSS74_14945 [Actinobacteria bacterium]|nr:hypothetical protein [Actinomycetota bacterium]